MDGRGGGRMRMARGKTERWEVGRRVERDGVKDEDGKFMFEWDEEEYYTFETCYFPI